MVAAGIAFLRVDVSIRTTGQVYSPLERRVFSPSEGILAARHVELGQFVKAGDALLELDDSDLVERLLALEREIVETESALAKQEILLKTLAVRPATLDMATAAERKPRAERIAEIQAEIHADFERGLAQQSISALETRRQEIERLRAEIERIETVALAEWAQSGLPELEVQAAQVERDRLARVLALLQRERTLLEEKRAARVIRAPLDGQVVAIAARHPGMAIARGAELLKVAPTGGPIFVRALVPERNVDMLRAGTPALMESKVFDSFLEGPVRGTVQRVAPDASLGADHPLYEVDIEVEATPHPLVLGSTLDVRLMLGRRSVAEILLRRARSERNKGEPT